MITFASLFTGGGLADIGAKLAGCELLWGIELRPEIAAIAQSNLAHSVYAQSVLDTDWSQLDLPDILWASPPCPNFSVAKTNASETANDLALAQSISEAIKVLQPKAFILENVEGYKRSQSLTIIEETLFSMGYWCNRQVVNAADFGVPQTRRRLILRAVRGGFVPSLPTPVPWSGWYQAIADLIPTLPETQLAEWQLKRMPEELRSSVGTSKAILMRGANTQQEWGKGYRSDNEPMYTLSTDAAYTKAVLIDPSNTIRDCTVRESGETAMCVTAEKMRRPASTPKVLLFSGTENNGSTISIREGAAPSLTVTKSSGDRQVMRVVDGAKVVQLSARCLARFQSMPDWYALPENNRLACTIIGNGVPCALAKEIISGLSNCLG